MKRTRRLVVRLLDRSDYQAWRDANAARLPQQNRFDTPARRPQDLNAVVFRKMVAASHRLARADRMYAFGLFDRRRGELVGTITLMVVMRMTTQLAWVGYGIYNHQWRRGYGKEGLAAVLDLAFHELSLHRVEAGIEPTNRASIALVRSLGMRQEATPRRAVWIDRRWRDLVVYVASAERWGVVPGPPSVLVSTAELSSWINGTWRRGGAPRSRRRARPAARPATRAGFR